MDRSLAEPLTQDNIVEALRSLGIQEGDGVVAHVSLHAMGLVAGGAGAVAKALLEAVGPRGTLMVPTPTFSAAINDRWYAQPFELDETPADHDVGPVPEVLRRMPEALRSHHPLMSVAAIGPLAGELTREHPMNEPVRPFQRLAELGGWILLIGEDHTANTTIHVAEVLAEVPYLSGPVAAVMRTPMGMRRRRMESSFGCSDGFNRLAPFLQIKEGRVGQAPASLMRGREVIVTALTLLERDPLGLTCERPNCGQCSRARMLARRRR
jgi:aminoglycoside N3'-acetyltransferase